ncbi:CST complex subunit TEN1 [Paroedura picta]|uniref:CST complex subunit TEN1 n=1 Tax=Paroedura picta TaxID=143630 RepID=UPI004057667C
MLMGGGVRRGSRISAQDCQRPTFQATWDLPSRPAVMMLPDAAKYHFPWEVNLESFPERKTLRTFGRLHSYDLVSSKAILTAQHNSVHHISVCTKFVEPFQAQLGSVYLVLGETELWNGEEVVLKARVFTCVEGINLPLLEKAILEQRKYFQERQKQLKGSNS